VRLIGKQLVYECTMHWADTSCAPGGSTCVCEMTSWSPS